MAIKYHPVYDWTKSSRLELNVVRLSNGIVYAICFVITLCILLKELKIKSKLQKELPKSNKTQTSTSKYQKLMGICSLTALIMFVLSPVSAMSMKTPFICYYSAHISSFIMTFNMVPIILYQLIRLQYTFASNQIHSTKFGYKPSIFKFLYAWGCFIMVFGVLIYIFFFKPLEIKLNGTRYGCEWEATNMGVVLLSLGALMYYGWDITILLLYVCKVKQFTKKTSDLNPVIHKRVSYILNKILFLTICYEIATFVSAAVGLRLVGWIGVYGYIGKILLNFIQIIISSLIAFLMIEHNDHIYNKIVHVYLVGYFKCNKWCCCCCCSNLLDVQHQTKDEKQIANVVDASSNSGNSGNSGNNGTTATTKTDKTTEAQSVDTKTVNPIEMDIDMHQSVDMSEYTQTKIDVDV